MSIKELYSGDTDKCPTCDQPVTGLMYDEERQRTETIPCQHFVWFGEPPADWKVNATSSVETIEGMLQSTLYAYPADELVGVAPGVEYAPTEIEDPRLENPDSVAEPAPQAVKPAPAKKRRGRPPKGSKYMNQDGEQADDGDA